MKNNIKKKVVINLMWSIAELYKFNHYYIFIMLLDGMLRGIAPIVSLLLTNKLINSIQLQQDSLQHTILLLGILILFEMLNALCSSITQLKLSNYELKFDVFIKCKILNKVSELDSKDFENSSTYDLIDRTQYDANTGILENIKKLFYITSLSISSISYIAIIIKYNIYICGIMIIIPIIRYLFEKNIIY